MSSALVQEILKSPDAVLQLGYLQAAMEEETIRRKEFREWITEEIKAEFVNGAIVVHSPVRRQHWQTSDLLSRLLSFYVSLKQLGSVGTEKVMISLSRNDYEPDLVFFSKEKAEQFTDEQVLFPAPDFVVEILSKSTEKLDRTTKKTDYALHGIKEYWIIDTHKQSVEQYLLPSESDTYFPAKVHQYGTTIKSYAVEGFEIPVAAIFDEAANVEALQALMQ
ncbi:MAG: Uma2 family endonuclease [Saprospiraceae bacterium]|nr:Uma2 family endonuclease [Saprospiraceae bacterium]